MRVPLKWADRCIFISTIKTYTFKMRNQRPLRLHIVIACWHVQILNVEEDGQAMPSSRYPQIYQKGQRFIPMWLPMGPPKVIPKTVRIHFSFILSCWFQSQIVRTQALYRMLFEVSAYLWKKTNIIICKNRYTARLSNSSWPRLVADLWDAVRCGDDQNTIQVG